LEAGGAHASDDIPVTPVAQQLIYKMEFLSPEGLRLDGRRPKELRQLKCELGVLQSADGSAIFEMGNTKAS
jgi:exosome complex RNA-binding protein Rrp42 (RNase PH superfamily)